jgi:site-specific recombinase XerD
MIFKKNKLIPESKKTLKNTLATYLRQEKELSKTTIKNYLVDLDRFIGYLKDQNGTDFLKIDNSKIENYKSYLLSTDLAKSTIKRRLSTVRSFCQMGVKKGWFKANYAQDVTNPQTTSETEKILDKFRSWLKAEGASKSTIKNYVSDVRNYLRETNS